MIGGHVADTTGRLRSIALADFLFTSGTLCMAAARSVPVIIFGRVVVGLGVGIASVVVPVYIAEVSPPGVRAHAVSGNVLAITGALAALYRRSLTARANTDCCVPTVVRSAQHTV